MDDVPGVCVCVCTFYKIIIIMDRAEMDVEWKYVRNRKKITTREKIIRP